MMNIGKLGSNESMGLNIKTGYAPNCVQSSDLKAAVIFVILPSQDGFGSDCPEAKFQTISS